MEVSLADHIAAFANSLREGIAVQSMFVSPEHVFVDPEGGRHKAEFNEHGNCTNILGWVPGPDPDGVAIYDGRLGDLLRRLAEEGWRVERPRPVFRLLRAAAGWGQLTQMALGALTPSAHWGCAGVWPEEGDGPCPQGPQATYGQDSRGLLNWTTTGDEDVPITTVLNAVRRTLNKTAEYQSCRADLSALAEEVSVWIEQDAKK